MFIKISHLQKHQQFWRALLATLSLVVVISIVLSYKIAHNGPRIRYIETINTNTSSLQTILVHTSLPLDPARTPDISLKPSTDFTVSIRGNSILINPKTILLKGTKYQLQIAGLTSVDGRKGRQNFAYSFQTAASHYYYLERNAQGSTDKLMYATVSEPQKKTVYAHDRIKTYAVTKDYIAIVTAQPDKSDKLALVDKVQYKAAKNLSLPENVYVTRFKGSPAHNSLALCISNLTPPKSGTTYDNSLELYDLDRGIMVEVRGLNGQPASCSDVDFTPRGGSIVYQTIDTSIFIQSIQTQTQPIAIGQAIAFSNFNFDQSKLLLIKNSGPASLTTKTRELSNIPESLASASQILYLHTKDTLLAKSSYLPLDKNVVQQTIVLVDANNKQSTILQRDITKDSISNLTVSFDDQYIAYESASLDSEYDSFNNFSRPKNVQLTIINSSSGSSIDAHSGSQVIWE